MCAQKSEDYIDFFGFAVADGATETSFAGLWARQLVRAYGLGCFDGGDWLDQLRREQAAWSKCRPSGLGRAARHRRATAESAPVTSAGPA